MTEDKFAGAPSEYEFGPPSEEVLRLTVRHPDGDITLKGTPESPGYRLTAGTPTWSRYMGYLTEAGIRPVLERDKQRVTADEAFTIMKEVVLRVPVEESVFYPMRPEIREVWFSMARQVKDIEAQGGMVDFEFPG